MPVSQLQSAADRADVMLHSEVKASPRMTEKTTSHTGPWHQQGTGNLYHCRYKMAMVSPDRNLEAQPCSQGEIWVVSDAARAGNL